MCFVHGVRKIKIGEEFGWLMVRYERIKIVDGMIWKKEKRICGGWRGGYIATEGEWKRSREERDGMNMNVTREPGMN